MRNPDFNNILDDCAWRQIAPYPEAAPSFAPNAGGSFTQASNGKRSCFGRIISDKFPVETGETYFVSVTAYPHHIRDEHINLHALINWHDNHWDDPSYWPPVTKRDYIKGVRAGDAIVFSGLFTAPGGLVLAGNPPVDAIYGELELCFKWSETGSVTWKDAVVTVRPAEKRLVRAASLLAIPTQSEADSLHRLLGLIDEAAAEKPDILCLNETVLTYNMDFLESAVTLDSGAVKAICGKAAEHGMYIVAGLVTDEDGILYNSALLIGPGGEIEGHYRKMQIPLFEAEKGLTPGDGLGVFDIHVNGRGVRIGIMICFDAEFPEIAAAMYRHGVEMIFIPTNGPVELGRRARDAGAYLVLSARPGGTRIFAPSGRLLAEGKASCAYEIDLNGQHTEEWTGPGPGHADVKTVLKQERRTDLYNDLERRTV